MCSNFCHVLNHFTFDIIVSHTKIIKKQSADIGALIDMLLSREWDSNPRPFRYE